MEFCHNIPLCQAKRNRKTLFFLPSCSKYLTKRQYGCFYLSTTTVHSSLFYVAWLLKLCCRANYGIEMVFSNSWWIAAVSRLIKCNYGRPHSSPLCGEKSPDFPIYGGFSSSREKCHIMLKLEKFTLKRRNKTSF